MNPVVNLCMHSTLCQAMLLTLETFVYHQLVKFFVLRPKYAPAVSTSFFLKQVSLSHIFSVHSNILEVLSDNF